MKAKVHPQWFEAAKVSCACGNTFTTGATMEELQVDVCSACHPFHTGQMKYVDTAGRVDAFMAKQKNAQKKVLSKSQRREMKRKTKIEKELERPDSLEDIRKSK